MAPRIIYRVLQRPLRVGFLSLTAVLSFLFYILLFPMMGIAQVADSFPNEQEKAWILQHPLIRVGIDPDWAPFSFRDKTGKFQGIDLEMLELISRRSGLHFEISSRANWNGVISAARAGQYDMLASTAISPQRQREFIFSKPYFDFPVAIITRQNGPFLISLDQLSGKRIASPREHVTTEALAADFPQLKMILTVNTQEALQMVSRGKADGTVMQLAHASYLIRELGLTNLKVSGITDYQFDLRYAVRTDWQELPAILDRAVQSVPRHEVASILSRWIHVDREAWVTWKTIRNYILGATILVAAVGLMLVLWNSMQRREIARRRRAEIALKAAHDRLEKLNDDKNSIMQMVAHDLRNPLTGILAGADLVKLEIAATGNKTAMESLDEIIELSGRIQNLVDELVTVTALESGTQILKNERFEAKMAVRHAVESLRTKAAAKNIELKATYPREECTATGDALALERIVDNLVSNALKFSRPGSSVELILEVRENWIALRIKDQGPGFTDEDKKKLFKKFSHLSAKPTAGEQSTGLGLSIVKALVTALNGEILFETKQGQGTTFMVTIPRHGGQNP